MRHALVVAILAAMLACAAPARAQPTGEGGPEIWDLSDPAAPRHWFTGLTCRGEVAGVPYRGRTAYDASGGDVSCSYARSGVPVIATLYMTMQRDAPIAEHVEVTRAAWRQRYRGTSPLADGTRMLATPNGEVTLHEVVMRVDGFDSTQGAVVDGVTGAWFIDVGGWTLKLRLTGAARQNLDWARATAEQILTIALADLDTARACAGAGAEAPPAAEFDEDGLMQVALVASMVSQSARAALPSDPVAARAAGFVCLGEAVQTRDGVIATAVLPLTPKNEAVGQVLALGEVRGQAAPMAAVFAYPAQLLGAENAPPVVQVGMSYAGNVIGFHRVTDQPPRLAAAILAADLAAGAGPIISVSQDDKD